MSADVNFEYCPIRTILQSVPTVPVSNIRVDQVVDGNKICLRSLATMAQAEDNGLDDVMDHLESRLGEEGFEDLMAGSNDLHGFGSWFVTRLRKAGFEVIGAEKIPLSFRG